ncbi:MAG: nucleotidyltransferase family protein [Elainellaceae cyanobacterium]
MKTLGDIKQWLEQHKSVLEERYQVKELGIFGSYVRQEQGETSDVDVLVEFSETPSLLKFVNLENYLSDNLGIKVDLVHKSGLKPRIGERILAEVIPILDFGFAILD